ncbi:hypothetical protein V501_01402 [Pseudogymnoascus sp. VKM F-4519 (FW-2642)]|nr:hypothetical protein V501_01402 [Pseudogymnoascus sp. VKM F-4519 (FW-2642)]
MVSTKIPNLTQATNRAIIESPHGFGHETDAKEVVSKFASLIAGKTSRSSLLIMSFIIYEDADDDFPVIAGGGGGIPETTRQEAASHGKDTTPPISVQFGEYCVKIDRAFVFGKAGPGAGMVINTAPGKFLLIGWGFNATFKSTTNPFTVILSFVEKSVVDAEKGILRTERTLNGDETRSGLFCIMPNEEPDYGGFPICVTIPARTMIAEVEA